MSDKALTSSGSDVQTRRYILRHGKERRLAELPFNFELRRGN